MDAKAEEIKTALLACGPGAVTASKNLISSVANEPITQDLLRANAGRLGAIRATSEAKEGLNAFFEKRSPVWLKKTK